MSPPRHTPSRTLYRRLVKNIRFIGGTLAARSRWSFRFFDYIGVFQKRIVTPQTDVCIEGFFRSANTFFVNVFHRWNRGVRHANHVHLPGQVLRAVDYGIPTLVLVRPPADAVASLIIMDENLDVGVALWNYIVFYRTVYPYRDRFVTGHFSEAIETPNRLVDRLNERFHTDFHSQVLTEGLRQRIMDSLAGRVAKKQIGPMWMHVPSAEKEQRKAAVKEKILRHRLYPRAEAAYRRMVGRAIV